MMYTFGGMQFEVLRAWDAVKHCGVLGRLMLILFLSLWHSVDRDVICPVFRPAIR